VTQPVLLGSNALSRVKSARRGAEANDRAISIASAQLAIRSLTNVATASLLLLPFRSAARSLLLRRDGRIDLR